MVSRTARVPAITLAVLLVTGATTGQEPAGAPSPEAPPAADPRLIEAERRFGVAELEAAQPLLDALVGELWPARKTLALEGRASLARALDLRAQILFTLGMTDEARSDLVHLVEVEPAYALDATRVSPKILRLFKEVRGAHLGSLSVSGSPADAEVYLDGRFLGRSPLVGVPALAGERRMTVTLQGHDPSEAPVSVAPGEEAVLDYTLFPNARTLLVRTEPAGVTVLLDGRPVGVTEPDPGQPEIPASRPLALEAVPPGSHELTFERDCFVPDLRVVEVTIDLQDNAPVALEPVRLRRSPTTLTLSSLPTGATLLLDGRDAGVTPLTKAVCPGTRHLALRVGDRVVWFEEREFGMDEQVSLEAWPRPTLAVAVPASLAETLPGEVVRQAAASPERRGGFNLVEIEEYLPAGSGAAGVHRAMERSGADLLLTLEESTDPVQPRLVASLWHRASPVPDRLSLPPGEFGRVLDLLGALARPWPWTRSYVGAFAVDRAGAPPVLGPLDPGSPAEIAGLRSGDRLLAVAGEPVIRARQLAEAVASADPGTSLTLRVRREGQEIELPLPVAAVVSVPGPREEHTNHTLLLARAGADRGVLEGALEQAATILGQASGLMHGKLWKEALGALRQIEGSVPGDPAGIVLGSARFLEGMCLEALGYRQEAAAAYRLAAGMPAARLLGPEGPPLAEVAGYRADRLSAMP